MFTTVYKQLAISITLLFSILLSGCASPVGNNFTTDEAISEDTETSYTITVKDGNYYLNFSDGNELINPIEQEGLRSFSLEFSSLGEMKDSFINNKLTDRQIETMKLGFPKDENGIAICNMNQLYEPVLPPDLVASKILLKGSSYGFTLSNPSIESSVKSITGSLSVVSPDTYQECYASEFTNFFNSDTISLDSQIEASDRNSIIYNYSTESGKFRLIQYDIAIGDKLLHVSELYFLYLDNTTAHYSTEISDTVPVQIEICGSENKQYFYIYLSGFTERPSVEWLSSFGLAEYVEPGNTVTK